MPASKPGPMSVLLILTAVTGFLLMAGCWGAPAHDEAAGLSGKLTMSGSSTLAPMVTEAAARFEALHPGVRIDVQTGGSSRGIRDVAAKVVDIGMSSRTLTEEEIKGLTSEAVAWDGVAFVVHASNPVEELSVEQLRKIYTGKFDNWQQVGGSDAPLVVSNRAEGRSELELITEFLAVEPGEIQADLIDGETQQSIKTVSGNVNAIVYTSIGAAQHAIDSGQPLKLLPLAGVAASPETVQAGQYPLARPLLILNSVETSTPLVKAFSEYLLSAAIDDIAISLGYVPPRRELALDETSENVQVTSAPEAKSSSRPGIE